MFLILRIISLSAAALAVAGLTMVVAAQERVGTAIAPSDMPGAKDTASVGKTQPLRPDFPASELGLALTRHLELLSGVGVNAEQQYQASLRRLRAQRPAATRLLLAAYFATEEGRYFRRWSYLETVRELNDPSALAGVARIASSAIPPNRFRGDPERSSIGEEIRIRVKAIEVLGQLARAGNAQADAELLRHLTNPHIGIRRAAIRGYLAAAADGAGRASRAEVLRRRVKQSDYGLITLATTDPRSVPHPDDVPVGMVIPKGKTPEGPPPKASRQR